MAHDKLRRTQVIFNSGPGAIVDLKEYSGTTAGLEEWPSFTLLEEIPYKNRRGFKRLLRPPSIKKHPFSGKEMTPSGTMPVYRFPGWVQCTNLNCSLFGPYWKLKSPKSDYKCMCGSSFVPSRIIKICPDGHMDDFPWDEFYHEGKSCEFPHPKFQLVSSKEQTGTLNDLRLRCRCGKHGDKGLNGIYEFEGSVKCWGTRPWLGNNERDCKRKSEVVLRGASNVYFPRVLPELIIPDSETKIELFFANHIHRLKESYGYVEPKDREAFLRRAIAAKRNEVSSLGISDEELIRRMMDRLEGRQTEAGELTKEAKIRADEYEVLSNPTIVNPDIVPKVFSAKKVEPLDVELERLGLVNLVTVSRLQEIRVLQGFTRVHPNPPKDKGKVVDLAGPDGSYLAIEVNGEGIFMSFDQQRLNKWAKERKVIARTGSLVKLFTGNDRFRPPPFEVDPRAIFLHSFSHAFIKQMALAGGYSSVSIRERLYLSEDFNGILIYTGDSDSEGTMGGITSLAEKYKFTEIFLEAIEDCRWCSSDPICSENSPEDGFSENLAACHACLHLSETSCELSNGILDRHSVTSEEGTGFFDE